MMVKRTAMEKRLRYFFTMFSTSGSRVFPDNEGDASKRIIGQSWKGQR